MKREWSDEELAGLLGAVRAEPDDAPLATALARLREERLPAWCAWTTRPWALAAACLLLAVSVAGGTWLGATGRLADGATASTIGAPASGESDPVSSLLGEDASGSGDRTSAARGDSGVSR